MMKSRQRGGTFLGLIFGLVAGLAVALVVAVYVTKVPVPFVHHQASRSPLQDEAEAERNKNWNPNAVLQSPVDADTSDHPAGVASGPVTPAPSPSTGLVPAEVPAATPPASTSSAAAPAAPTMPLAGNLPAPNPSVTAETRKGVQPSPVRSAKAPSADPLGALVASRTPSRESGRAGGTAASTDQFLYYVQAGAFRNSQDADAQRARLSLLGVEARVSERDQSGRRVYRVRVGPFQDHTGADRVQTQLASNGFDAALVREQR